MRKEKSRRKKEELPAQFLLSIASVFKQKNWKIMKTENPAESHFNRFCERMQDINDEKGRELLLDLTKRYLWLPQELYFEHLENALEKLLVEYRKITSKSEIYVMQLIAPKDEKKIKSSAMMLYSFNDMRLRMDARFLHYKFEIVSNKKVLPKKLESQDAVVVLVDDYIGTGDTAISCVEALEKYGIKTEQMAVLSLVAQEEGKRKLEKKGVFVCTSILRKRGISDFYVGEERDKNIKIMHVIESDLKVEQKYKFGYGESEALVTMCRTPNNTFPVFWYEPEQGNEKKYAPFPRF